MAIINVGPITDSDYSHREDLEALADECNRNGVEYSATVVCALNGAGVEPSDNNIEVMVEQLAEMLDEWASEHYASFGIMPDPFDANFEVYGYTVQTGNESLEDARDSGYVVDVSDHGNVSLYTADGDEVWAVV